MQALFVPFRLLSISVSFILLLALPSNRSQGQTVSTKVRFSGTVPGTATVIPPSLREPDNGGEIVPYPADAQKEGKEGTVRLKLLVGADGSIDSSIVLENGGDNILLFASMEGINNVGFTPGSIDGQVQECWVIVEIVFSMGSANKGEGQGSESATGSSATENTRDTAVSDMSDTAVSDIDRVDPDIIPPKYDKSELASVLQYPKKAIKARLEGNVQISVRVSTEGKALRVVVQRVSDSIFIEPTVKAARQLQYTPAMQNGVPIEAWLTFLVTYKFDG